MRDTSVKLPFRRDTMEIYDMFKWPADVKSEDWSTLTLEQKKLVMDAYRFGAYKPGTYQGATFHGPEHAIL